MRCVLCVVIVVCFFSLVDGAQEANKPVLESRYAIKELVPTELWWGDLSRIVIRLGPDGKPLSEVQLPTHRSLTASTSQERAALGPRKHYFLPPGDKMKSPDWRYGSVHILVGHVTIGRYEFDSDSAFPLVFKVVKGQGYVFLCGKGEVRTKDGPPQKLGQEEDVDFWLKRSVLQDALAREGAAQALGYLGAKGTAVERELVQKALMSLLADKSPEIRISAIDSLVRVAAKGAVDLLEKTVAEDKDDWVKTCAKWAITCLSFGGDIHYEVEQDNIEKVEELLKVHPDLANAKNEMGLTPLHVLAMQMTLSISLDSSARGTAGTVAPKNAPTRMVSLLISKGADVNAMSAAGMSPLQLAVRGNNLPFATLLIQKGAQVDVEMPVLQGGGNLLHVATSHDNPEMVGLLIAARVPLNGKMRSGFTPVHTAAWMNSVAAARVLLDAGAEVNPQDEKGMTPLAIAVKEKHQEMVDLLKKHGGQ